MKQLSPYEVLQSEVDRIAAEVTEPSAFQFSDFFVRATIVLAAYGDTNQARNATMCGYALRSMDDEDREAFLATVDTPSRVYQQMAAPDDWPIKPATHAPELGA